MDPSGHFIVDDVNGIDLSKLTIRSRVDQLTISRSSSAPPVVPEEEFQGLESISPQDPRLDINYYNYYYSQRPLDPRLPPPLITPYQAYYKNNNQQQQQQQHSFVDQDSHQHQYLPPQQQQQQQHSHPVHQQQQQQQPPQ
ncbi:hypothetical protein DDB_G0279865, partial [Dictyostelium discoideum AX4]